MLYLLIEKIKKEVMRLGEMAFFYLVDDSTWYFTVNMRELDGFDFRCYIWEASFLALSKDSLHSLHSQVGLSSPTPASF